MNNPSQHRNGILGIRTRAAGAVLALAILLGLATVAAPSAQGQTLTTTTVLTSSPNPSGFGASVTFTATVTGQSGGTPTGTVTFSNGSGSLTAPVSGGTASITTSELPVGTSSITAVYSGDSNFAGSTSNTLVQVVSPTYAETVLHSFTGSPDGIVPYGSTLVRDAQGNLYGTTAYGGDASCSSGIGIGCGTVFKVDATGKETVLYSFIGTWVGSVDVGDGMYPYAGVVLDAQGNLYGTTAGGGTHGAGAVFKLDTTGKETVLYSFGGTAGDGADPSAGLVLDAQGNLYGTTMVGGDTTCTYLGSCGTVFKVDATGKETVLYRFTGTGGDGANPMAGLVLDAQGNLYGTTYSGGTYGNGTVFKLDTTGKETVLYSFTGTGGDGAMPRAGLVLDAEGNLYGTTGAGGSAECGSSGCGALFKLDTTGKETVLFSSFGEEHNGWGPYGGLVLDAEGNLYGTTFGGGSGSSCEHGCGTVFKVDTSGNGTVLYSFAGGADSAYPDAGLVRDAEGDLYGTTRGGAWATGGSASAGGTVFELTALAVAGVSPASLTFGSQSVGTTSGSQPLTLSNTGAAALAITSIAASANFGQTNNCGGSVAASGSCTINVTFSPTATGSLRATLTITDNSNGVKGSTQTVGLTGTGTPSTPQEQISSLQTTVGGLVSAGTLSPGQGQFLLSPLNAALAALGSATATAAQPASNPSGGEVAPASLNDPGDATAERITTNRGHVAAAIRDLEEFISRVQLLMSFRRLSRKEGRTLIDAAESIINALRSKP